MSNVYQLDDYRPKVLPEGEKLSDEAIRVRFGALAAEAALLAERFEERIKRREQQRATNRLESALPIILYQISWGRNAWHSTWVARYQRDTLTASRKEAQDFIGKRLKQGTAFRMTVMPGLHLKFRDSSFLVAEINTKTPFERLVDPAFAKVGIVEKQALELLEPNSNIWRGFVPSHDSVVVQETRRPAGDFQPWNSRTVSPEQVRTPGPYKREIEGAHWHMSAIVENGQIEYDTSAFQRALNLLVS